MDSIEIRERIPPEDAATSEGEVEDDGDNQEDVFYDSAAFSVDFANDDEESVQLQTEAQSKESSEDSHSKEVVPVPAAKSSMDSTDNSNKEKNPCDLSMGHTQHTSNCDNTTDINISSNSNNNSSSDSSSLQSSSPEGKLQGLTEATGSSADDEEEKPVSHRSQTTMIKKEEEVSLGASFSELSFHPNTTNTTTTRINRRGFPKKKLSTRFDDSGFSDIDMSGRTKVTLPTSDHGENNSYDLEEEEQQRDKIQSTPSSHRGGPAHLDDMEQSDNSIHFEDSSSDSGETDFQDSSHYTVNNTFNRNSRKNNSMRSTTSSGQRKNAYTTVSPTSQSTIVKYTNAIRIICGKIVNHTYVQGLIVFLIIMNALQMGLSTFPFVYENPGLKSTFEKADVVFLIIFTIEIIFQFIFHGLNLFKDGWLAFDMLIVISSWCFASLQIFRTLRTLRLVARVEMLRKLCQALMEAVPRLAGIVFLFILVMYIYAVMATILFGDMYAKGQTDDDYFSGLGTTLFTLFQMITLDWANIARQVMAVYPASVVVFVTYLSFTSFILFSLIIGVVCDAVSAIEHDSQLVEILEKKENAQERILRMQQRVDYLKRQQESVLASVSGVLEALEKAGANNGLEPFSPQRGFGGTRVNKETIQEEEKSEEFWSQL